MSKDNTTISLKYWADEDKPREKMLAKGKKNLSDAELIAILLGSGSQGESAVELAKKLLAAADQNLSQLAKMEINELSGQRFKGMGPAKAITIVAALELGYRLINSENAPKDDIIKNSTDMFNYICPVLIDLPHEEFWVIFFNNRNKALSRQCVSKGGLTDTAVDVRQVFHHAIETNAVSIALIHNHPSGKLKPSKQDKDLTNRIIEAGRILRIAVLDHLIIGIDPMGVPSYYSFSDNGDL